MIVPDLPTLNSLLAQCCDCGLPACADGTVLCQSMTRTASCADDDYTDAMAVWEVATLLLEEWTESEATFAARHAAWVDEKDDWEACMATLPCIACAAEPVEPVHLPEPAAPGDEPEMPAGYNDVTHSCYFPFTTPPGDPDDDLPLIYRTLQDVRFVRYSGTMWIYRNSVFPGAFDLEREELTVGTYVSWPGDPEVPLDATYVDTGNEYDPFAPACDLYVTPGIGGLKLPDEPTYTDPATDNTCEVASSLTTRTSTSSEGGALTLHGCPGSFGADRVEYAWDLTRYEKIGYLLDSPISKSDLITRATGKLPGTWPAAVEGSSCDAATVTDWPTIAETDIPECTAGDYDGYGYGVTPTGAGVTAECTIARYKIGIPTAYMAHRLWIDEHAAWVIAHARWVTCGSDPETEPAEPAEPQIFHYFKSQWDTVKLPAVWEVWRIIYDAWVDATALHAAWVIEHAAWVDAGSDPETEPVEPVVPPDPTADQPAERPEFIDENLTWTWTGGETEAAQYSAWYELAVPTTEARVIICNRQNWCYQAVALGVPPTVQGEVYNPDDYPA